MQVGLITSVLLHSALHIPIPPPEPEVSELDPFYSALCINS